MEYKAAVQLHNIKKEFKKFSLKIEHLTIPEGFATALIGENGKRGKGAGRGIVSLFDRYDKK